MTGGREDDPASITMAHGTAPSARPTPAGAADNALTTAEYALVGGMWAVTDDDEAAAWLIDSVFDRARSWAADWAFRLPEEDGVWLVLRAHNEAIAELADETALLDFVRPEGPEYLHEALITVSALLAQALEEDDTRLKKAAGSALTRLRILALAVLREAGR